jgi:argininosuccinate lyase
MQTETHKKNTLLTDARLKELPSESLVKYSMASGLAREKRHFYQFIKVDLAHTVMLVEENILTKQEGARILTTLKEIETLGLDNFPTDPAKGSFLLQVEDYLFGRIGEDVGGRMHTGRSRIDQGATVRRLFKRDRLLDVLDRLVALQAVILNTANRHSNTIMPGYTHMQHAQPWVFGHYLLSVFDKFSEDFQRVSSAYARVNLNPLGTVGLSGTSWPINRDRTTELLGFGGLVENSKLGREAYYAAEAIAMLSFVMSDLNDLATDLHVWSTFEFGLVETADQFCGTSSIFPQKKNPTALETIKKAAGGSITWLATALGTFRAEGTGDQAMRELPLLDDALKITENMLELMTGVLDTLIAHADRMKEIVAKNWSTASNLADFIVKETGLSYRQAHHVVGRVVRTGIGQRTAPAETTGEMVDNAAKETIGSAVGLSTGAVRDALNPEIFVKTRVTRGSVNPDEVNRMIGVANQSLDDEKTWIAGQRKTISKAYEKLERAVQTIV